MDSTARTAGETFANWARIISRKAAFEFEVKEFTSYLVFCFAPSSNRRLLKVAQRW
jgi:hypothetical protein